MLSIERLKSASKAKDYYASYAQEADVRAPQGQWFGKGAAALDLTGTASPKTFMQVLEGELGTGIRMAHTQTGQYHRPGYDLTFSAPKSVSILAIILRHEGIFNAHRMAVQQALTLIEQDYAATRVKHQGQIHIEKTDNLIFSIFEHTDSRALDPNLHSHCILMNATQREDGHWRTLYSYPLYRDKILLGMHYRCFLAQELMKLGFEIVQTSENGTFELKDFPASLMKQFSKRRADIEAVLEERGVTGGKAAKVATLETRPAKQKVDSEHLTLAWTVELQQCGLNIEWLIQYALDAESRGPITPPNPEKQALDAVRNATAHLSEWQAVFDVKALLKASLGLSIVTHPESLLHQAISQQITQGALLYLGDNRFTTPTARELEIETLATMRLHQKQINPVFGKIAAVWMMRPFKDTLHPKALHFLLTNTDREVMVSATETDFQSVMAPYCAMIARYGLYPTLLTQHPARAHSFAKAMGRPYARTIAGFLVSCEKRMERDIRPKSAQRLKDARSVWIVDSESEVGLTQVRELQRYAHYFGARIIWGYHPLKPSFAMEAFIQHGIRRCELIPPSSPPMHTLLTEKDLKKIFTALEEKKQITEIADFSKRMKTIAECYLRSPEETQILTVSHYERSALNQAIRAARKANGVITGPAVTFNALEPVGLTRAQLKSAKFYQLNDVVRLSQDWPALKLTANTYFTVTEVQLHNKKVVLTDGSGTYLWTLNRETARAVQLYRQAPKPLQVNDVIVWNQTVRSGDNRALDRLKGERATVIAVTESEVWVRLNNQETITLNPSQPKDAHWDYGYARLLSDAALGGRAIIALKSQTGYLTYERFAKALANLPEETYLFCDDIATVKARLWQSRGETLSARQPVQPYASPDVLDAARVKAYFPKFSARMEGAFGEHRQLLTQVMSEYEQEQALMHQTTHKTQDSTEEPTEEVPPALPVYQLVAAKEAQSDQTAPTAESLAIREGQVMKACQAIDWLCAKYAERNAVFKLKDLQKELFKNVGLTIPKEILQEQLTFALEQKILLPVQGGWVDVEEPNDALVTTQEMAALEKACLYLAQKYRQTVEPVMAKDAPILADMKASELTEGQQSAIELILTTSDRIVGIQGVAGVGKTTMLRALNRHAIHAGYPLLGLSNSTAARQQLQTGSQDLSAKEAFLQAGVTSMTTRRFLIRAEALLKKDPALAEIEYGGHRILVLDEASFTSTRDMFSLLNVVAKLNVRLVVMGDYKQLNSVEAGRIFYLLLGSPMKSIAMTHNVRFSALQALRTMQFIYQNQIGDALETLSRRNSLIEIEERSERLTFIAKLYLEKDALSRANTLVITPWHQDRKAVNRLIHQGLKKQGVLQGKAFRLPILTPVNRTTVEKQRIYGFAPQHWIRFNQAALGVAIGKGEYCRVIEKNFLDQTLRLQKLDGSYVYWSPERNLRSESGAIEIYRPEERVVMVNEQIRWLKNDESRGIRNGETATVVSVEKTRMEVLLQNGARHVLTLECKADQHWDYAYAATAYVAQGADKPETIAHGVGGGPVPEDREKKFNLTSVEEFLVSVTRGDKVTLVVDDIETYQETLGATLDTKRSAQEYLAPNRADVKEKVHAMTHSVTGKAERAGKEAALDSEVVQSAPQNRPSPTRSASGKRARIDADELLERLEHNILGYATQWLGKPSAVSGKAARWGKKGSFVVHLSGAKAGSWYDFEIGKGGRNLIGLYQELHGVDYKRALQEMAQLVGLNPEKPLFKTQMQAQADAKRAALRQAKAEQAAKELERAEAKKIQQAREGYAKGIPIANTLAEKYLRVYRGIQGPLPEDFRFCTKLKHRDTGQFTPALIAPIRNGQGDVQGMVRIFLDKTGDKLKANYLDALGTEKPAANKMNLGVMKAGAVMVNEGQSKETLYIAEGIETALSVAMAVPEARVCASLSVSQLRNVPTSNATQTIVLCADEDGQSAASSKILVEAANYYLRQGFRVEIAYPGKVQGFAKTDFNDVLKQGGVEAVAQRLHARMRICEPLSVSQWMALKNTLESRNAVKEPVKSTYAPPQVQSPVKELER